mgnify:CR=1 FL=1
MNIFPTTSINNFFKEPGKVVKFAKSLKYEKSETGSYPGERTKNLAEVDYTFFNTTILSILSMYYEDFQNIGYSDTYLGCLLYTSPSPRDQRGSRLAACA